MAARPPDAAAGVTNRIERLRRALEGDDVLSDEEAELVREGYGELLEECRDREADFVRVRELGRLIERAQEDGRLPRALIRRGPR